MDQNLDAHISPASPTSGPGKKINGVSSPRASSRVIPFPIGRGNGGSGLKVPGGGQSGGQGAGAKGAEGGRDAAPQSDRSRELQQHDMGAMESGAGLGRGGGGLAIDERPSSGGSVGRTQAWIGGGGGGGVSKVVPEG